MNNINAPIGVSAYKVTNALPSVETLQRELENVVIEHEAAQEKNNNDAQ